MGSPRPSPLARIPARQGLPPTSLSPLWNLPHTRLSNGTIALGLLRVLYVRQSRLTMQRIDFCPCYSLNLFVEFQSRSQYVHHFCDGVTTLINHTSITTMSTLMKVGAINWAPGASSIAPLLFHERRHETYRDMVAQSCNTVTKVMHVLGARLIPNGGVCVASQTPCNGDCGSRRLAATTSACGGLPPAPARLPFPSSVPGGASTPQRASHPQARLPCG